MRQLKRCVVLLLLLSLAPFVRTASASSQDNTFREGWSLLSEEKFAEAREAFGEISPDEYDLGDYVLYFTGVALSREGKPEEAAKTLEGLTSAFSRSPLIPYLAHELAFAAAKAGDIPSTRKYFRLSRGKVGGDRRRAAEGYIVALLMEEPEEELKGEQEGDGQRKKAAEAYLENFASSTVQEGGLLSMERLWEWYREGKLSEWNFPVTFYEKYANALFRAGEDMRARAVYQEATEKFPLSDDYYELLLDYAEFLRKKGETAGAQSLLAGVVKDAPAPFRSEVDFLSARVEWMAGRTAEARRRFLEIAESDAPRDIAERARYQAAWISEEEGDWEGSAEQFRKLFEARDERSAASRYFATPSGSTVSNATPMRSWRSIRGKNRRWLRWSGAGTRTGGPGPCPIPGRNRRGRRCSASSRRIPTRDRMRYFRACVSAGIPSECSMLPPAARPPSVRMRRKGFGKRYGPPTGRRRMRKKYDAWSASPGLGWSNTPSWNRNGWTGPPSGKRRDWPTGGRPGCSGIWRVT